MPQHWLKLAHERFPQATSFLGEGRWAVGVKKDGVVRVVYLALTEAQQRAIALGVEHPDLQDLKPKFVPTHCAEVYDVEEARRERRERRQAK